MKKNVKKIIENYQKKFLPIIKKHIKNKTLLDAGCGNGLNSFFFNKKLGSKITLLDIKDMRDKEVECFPFFKSSIEKMPFKSNSFDAVFIQYVLHHLLPQTNFENVFRELKRVGEIVILVEEIITKKTEISKAKKFDMKINKIFHPSQKMPIYKYYSDKELKNVFSNAKIKIIKEKVFDEGCKEDGFLQRKIYILK